MRKTNLLLLGIFVFAGAVAQTLYVPGGTSGIGNSANSNIGIGTSNPTYKLHIVGDSFTTGWIRTKGSTGLYFNSYGGGFRMTDNSWIRTYGDKSFYHNTGIMRTDGQFQVGPNGDRFIVRTDGRVGIGTNSPAQELSVNGQISWGNSGALLRTDQGASIELRGTGVPYIDFSNDAGTDYDARLILRSNDALELGGANLLIGKSSQTNSSYKLDINGKMRASEIVVNTNGADFVFEPDYDLPQLKDVETFITKNRHLPGIPSALEMQNEGMAVGAVNIRLLQKIEELTLYMIELKKENEAISQRLEKLENENE
jgi:hypothetical protein